MNPFLALHSLEFLHLSKTQTSLLTSIAPILGMACSSRFWGEVVKRYGNRPVMRFSSMGLLIVPLGWLFATSRSWPLLFGALLFPEVCFARLKSAIKT
jgi:nitrate/nitrite transporter NarK